MNIFILEDDIFQQQKLERIIVQQATEQQIPYQKIYATARPEHLLQHIDNAVDHQIYFLDLEIKRFERKGFEVAQSIREKDPYGTIVFVTTHSEMAPVTFAYKVSALDFIDKTLPEELFQQKVLECLQIAQSHCAKPLAQDAFNFENKNTSFQIPFADILYFETSDISHKIRLITKNRMLEFYADLAEIEKIDDRLLRCHRAFVINLANVEAINKVDKTAIFSNGDECLVSRRALKKVTEELTRVKQQATK